MLRGPQTPGELKQRTERLHRFDGLDRIDEVLERLADRELVVRLDRRPGQKEQRYEHLLGGEPTESEPAAPALGRAAEAEDDRLAALERELEELRGEVAALRAELRGG